MYKVEPGSGFEKFVEIGAVAFSNSTKGNVTYVIRILAPRRQIVFAT
jgi:hypothetical protein